VAVDIVGYRVCTLGGPEGERYRRFLASTGRGGMALCDALVTGGWLREEGEGYFAVHLDLAWPFRFHEDVPLERAAFAGRAGRRCTTPTCIVTALGSAW
jgi:hypothetical protein